MEPTGGATKEPEAPFASRWVDRLLGYDYFISYAHDDGTAYAIGLAQRLRRDLDLVCFLDRDDFEVGGMLSTATSRAASRASQLLVVLTPAALVSPHVYKEIELFRGRPVVPILTSNIDASDLSQSALGRLITEDVLWLADPVSGDAQPTDHAVAEIARSFRLMRQSRRRLLIALAFALVLLVVSVAAVVMAKIAVERARALHSASIMSAVSATKDPALKVALVAELAPDFRNSDAIRTSNEVLSKRLAHWVAPTKKAGVIAIGGSEDSDEFVVVDAACHVAWWTLGRQVPEHGMGLPRRARVDPPPSDMGRLPRLGCVATISPSGRQVALVWNGGLYLAQRDALEMRRLPWKYPVDLGKPAYSPTGRQLALASGGRLIVWDLSSAGQPGHQLFGSPPKKPDKPAPGFQFAFDFSVRRDQVWTAAFSPCGHLWTGHQDGVRVWDASTHEERTHFLDAPVRSLRAGEGHAMLVSTDERIWVMDCKADRLERTREIVGERLLSSAPYATADALGVVGIDVQGMVRAWWWPKGESDGKATSAQLGTHAGVREVVVFGERAVTYGAGSAQIWNLGKAAGLPERFQGHEGMVTAAWLAPTGRLFSGSSAGELRAWTLPQEQLSLPGHRFGTDRIASHPRFAISDTGVAVVEDRWAVRLGADALRLGNAQAPNGSSVLELEPKIGPFTSPSFQQNVTGVAVHPSGRAAAVTSEWGISLYRLDAVRAAGLRFGKAPDEDPPAWLSVTFLSDGVRGVNALGAIVDFSLTGEERSRVQLPQAPALARAFFATPQLLGLVFRDGRFALASETRGWQWTQRLTDRVKHDARIAVLGDGEEVAVGVEDEVRLHALRERAERRLRHHVGNVSALAYSPDGRWIVSGSLDRTIVAMDREGEIEDVRISHDGPVVGVEFSSANTLFVLTETSGEVDLYERWLDLERLVASARPHRRRCLTAVERRTLLGETRQESSEQSDACNAGYR